MEQTAVEWFFDRLKNHEIQGEHYLLYVKAKAIEKEQIIKALERGFDEGCKFPEDRILNDAEQYYNETYNK
jgi:hypothetical protein